jgi:hypothetical protein
MVYPFNENGIKIASVGTKRFGAIIYALTEDNLVYIPDDVDNSIVKKMEELMPKIQDVGIKRLLTGILVKRTRTAAFQYDGLNKDNRLEPETLRDVGLIGMHIKAGNTTPPLLVEVLGGVKDWSSKMLDELASQIISLIAFDQKKALPLPLWYAKYALKPVEATNNGKNVILEYYKTQAREMLQSEALESIWKEDLNVFED